METTTQAIPRHIEAAKLGAHLGTIRRAQIHSGSTARDILAVWDYRKAGIKVDQAREQLAKWLTPTYHHNYDPYGKDAQEGRYGSLHEHIKRWRASYERRLAWVNTIPLANSESKPIWNFPHVRIITGGRTIIVERNEDVTWGDNYKHGRWPQSKRVSYRSYLIPVTTPSAKEIIAKSDGYADEQRPLSLRSMAERSIGHDLRGHWWAKVITELLGVDYVSGYKWITPEHVETVYKIVESNGHLRSVYAPDMVYPLGEWVTDPAKPDHEGGIYAYLDGDYAVGQARSNSTFNAAWVAGKDLVLCKCEAKGRCIRYDSGKLAYSSLRVIEVIKTISN